MNQDLHLKLQACLDGELAGAEEREVAELLRSNAAANALFAELRNTRGALTGFDAEIKLPESREFYWSKIKRDIERLETSDPARPATSLWAVWRRMLVPASAAVTLAFVALVASFQLGYWSHSRLPGLQTAMSDPGAFTYRDDSAGMTVVWLSYSGENEFAESGPAATLQ